MTVWAPILFAALMVVSPLAEGFPDGAPIEACILPKPNRPNHPGTKPLPPHDSPYTFTASSSAYSPGQTIYVYIGGAPMKGFFVQARDSGEYGDWVGEWVKESTYKIHNECSAITHSSPAIKNDITLTWKAPPNRSGKVSFVGTILAKYDTYWSDLVADVPPGGRRF